MRIIKYILPAIKIVLAQFIAAIISFFVQSKRIWLIGEKRREARDNGFHFYKYLVTEHPEIVTYYAIVKTCPDFRKVNKLGKVVGYNSFIHCILYFMANVRACSQVHGVRPYEDFDGLSKLFFYRRKNQKHIHLKHGIAKDLLDAYDFRKCGYDLLICGATPEYEFYKKRFNYPDDNIALTGLCRYDALARSETKNIILIMPTFREWLRSSDSSKESASEIEMMKFKDSDYYINFSQLLQLFDYTLKEKGDMKVIFYLHYTMQPFRNAFLNYSSEKVIIASRNEYDVQQLLKEAKVLVTDYSSVYSDFVYMQKPVIYFQFDEERYRREHYSQGYFEYHRDGFGPVLSHPELVVEYYNKLRNYNFVIEPYYRERLDGYFPFYDEKNCERVFNAITQLYK